MMTFDSEKVIDLYVNNIQSELRCFMQKLSTELLTEAMEMILYSESMGGRVHVTGIGKPSYVGKYMASLLSSTGTPTYFLDGTEAIHGSAGQVMLGDIVIALSNSGETEELKKSIITLKKNGAKIISVTGESQSWLAKNSDCTLLARVNTEGDTLNKPPRASILVEMIMLQILSVLLQEKKNLTTTTYYKWHPGGALGKTIEKNI